MNPGLIQNIERKKTRNLSNKRLKMSDGDQPSNQSTIYKPKFQGRSYRKKNIIYTGEAEFSKSSEEQEQPSFSTSSLSKSSNHGLDVQEISVSSEQRIHIQASEMPRIFFCSKIYKIEYVPLFG